MLAAARAYQQTARNVLSGRQLEAAALQRCIVDLLAARRSDLEDLRPLMDALRRNCDLWHILMQNVSEPGSDLPQELRLGIGRTAEFVFAQTRRLSETPSLEALDILIAINRNLAAGLQGQPA